MGNTKNKIVLSNNSKEKLANSIRTGKRRFLKNILKC